MSFSFCRRSSNTFRCEFECFVSTNVGLEAGLYSGTNQPDLYLTPHALQSVFGPMGLVRHCGVLSVAQCRHFLPSLEPLSLFSFFLAAAALTVFFPGFAGVGMMMSGSEDDVVGERTRRREVQLHGAPRDRLLRVFGRNRHFEVEYRVVSVGFGLDFTG